MPGPIAGSATPSTGANNPFNAIPVSPQVEAIQEFKVQTNSLSAEYGRTGGGVLNFILKSGTNDLHWTLFEFLRNSKLDANNFFSNQRGIGLATFQRNQFGGVIGGPVIIPRVLNGGTSCFSSPATKVFGSRSRTRRSSRFPP